MLAEGSGPVKGRCSDSGLVSRGTCRESDIPGPGRSGAARDVSRETSPSGPSDQRASRFTGNIPVRGPASAAHHGPPPGHADPPGPAVRRRFRGREQRNPGSLFSPKLRPEQAELGQPNGRPTLGSAPPAARSPPGGPRHRGSRPRIRPSSPADQKPAPPPGRTPPGGPAAGPAPRPARMRRRPIAQPEPAHSRLEERASALVGHRARPRWPRPQGDQNQPGDAGAGAEIEESASEVAPDGRRQRLGVIEMQVDRSGPEDPPPAGVLELDRQATAKIWGEHRSPAITPVGSRPGGGAPRPPRWSRRRRSRRRRRARPSGRAPTSARAPAPRPRHAPARRAARVNSDSASRRFAR